MDVSETNFKILGLAASLRRASIHRGLLRAAHEVCLVRSCTAKAPISRIGAFRCPGGGLGLLLRNLAP